MLGLLLLSHVVLLSGGAAAAEEKELFACTFPTARSPNRGKRSAARGKSSRVFSGSWTRASTIRAKRSWSSATPRRCPPESSSAPSSASTRGRATIRHRAGVGLCCDPENGYGLNLAFNRGQLQFVHDYVTWAPGCAFSVKTGTWYWMKLCKTPGALRGKAWRDGEPEPADWMVSWTGFDESLTGYPALLGCVGRSGGGRIDGLLRRVPRGANRPGPGGVLHQEVNLAGNDGRQSRCTRPAGRRHGRSGRQGRKPAAGGPLATARARLLRSAVAPANGLGAAGRHLAAGRAMPERAGRAWPSAMPAPRGPVWPGRLASWPRT